MAHRRASTPQTVCGLMFQCLGPGGLQKHATIRGLQMGRRRSARNLADGKDQPASISFNTAMICSSAKRDRFACPSFGKSVLYLHLEELLNCVPCAGLEKFPSSGDALDLVVLCLQSWPPIPVPFGIEEAYEASAKPCACNPCAICSKSYCIGHDGIN